MTLEEIQQYLPDDHGRRQRFLAAMAALTPDERAAVVQHLQRPTTLDGLAERCGPESPRLTRRLLRRSLKRLASEIARQPVPVAYRRLATPRLLKVLLRWPRRDPDPD